MICNNMVKMDSKCIVCNNKLSHSNLDLFDTRYGISGSYTIHDCPTCNLMCTANPPQSTVLRKYYEEYYNYPSEKKGGYIKLRELFFSSLLYKVFLMLDGDISFYSIKGSGRLLDVGCNEGRGLHFYNKNGFDAEGLEINQKAADSARRRGFVVHTQQMEDFHPNVLYDVVVLSNVLEHSPGPVKMLRNINRVLKPGGRVWISCPNNGSWLRRVFGKYWINWHVPFHIFHFSERSLKLLLEKSGFRIKCIRYETPGLWVSQSIIARLLSKKGEPTRHLRNPYLIGGLMGIVRFILFPFLWLGNVFGWGDCVIVMAVKE